MLSQLTFTATFRLSRCSAPTLPGGNKADIVLKPKQVSNTRLIQTKKQAAAVRDLSSGRWGGRKLGGVQKEEGSTEGRE